MENEANLTQADCGSSSESSLTARLFGGFELRLDNAPVTALKAAKDRWLLALLLLAHGKPLERGLVAVTLWPFPDFDAGRAAANLRRGLWTLRQTLGSQVWRLQSPTPDTIAFDLTDAWVDLVEFDLALAQGDRASLERALALHRAPAASLRRKLGRAGTRTTSKTISTGARSPANRAAEPAGNGLPHNFRRRERRPGNDQRFDRTAPGTGRRSRPAGLPLLHRAPHR